MELKEIYSLSYASVALNSPFRYAGGKFYARKLILEYILPHSNYIEPFAGGASIFFAKDKVEHNWLNDIDEDLINCYLFIQNNPEALIEGLKGEEASKERHTWFKREFVINNDLDRAIRWFYLNRTSYSGIMNKQNCFWGYGRKYSMPPENWPRNIWRTSAKLQGVKFTSLDFEQVISETADGSFLFIDPPYFNADQDKFYTYSFVYEDHLRLARVLRKHHHRFCFLLTYDNTPEILELYNWALQINEKEWNYTLNRTDDQSKNGKQNLNGKGEKGTRYKGKELFIINYGLQELKATQLSLL